MRRVSLVFLPLLAFAAPRVTTAFDSGWRFLKSDAPGAERPDFDDSRWRTIDVPHDWSIEGPFDESNPTGRGGGYLPAGVGWYRKRFHTPAGQHVFLEFDGVMANSDVWLNGVHLGKRPNGYVSFRYELTSHLKHGAENLIAVRADNSGQPASRWYTGAGVYRHVRLVTTDAVHISPDSTFLSTLKIMPQVATLRAETTVVNQSRVPRTVSVAVDLGGATTPQTIAPGGSARFEIALTIRAPRVWDICDPHLYRAKVTVREGAAALDDESVSFGIREARFESDSGFWLNGKNLKLKGVALHHDGGAFGAAVPLGVWEQRLTALKKIGVNAIRTAHNPPAPEFLDLCDEMGFLVMDEMFDCWTVAKTPHDYHLFFDEWSLIDLRETVRRDRNHPSVILWSAGNEIHDTPKEDLAKTILKRLVDEFHGNDPTRPVTQALFRPNVSHDYTNGLADMLDVVGTNYRFTELLAAHNDKPTRKILGTENTHELAGWLAVQNNPQYAGYFLWTGADYLGEADWPNVTSSRGLLDRTGALTALGYERQSWWSERPMVHIVRDGKVPHDDWNPFDAEREVAVAVYSNAESVELSLNGKSLGEKRRLGLLTRTWRVPFEPGILRAVGRDDGHVVAMDELQTAGKSSTLLLWFDRAGPGMAFVTATVADEGEVRNPLADDLVTFSVSGPASIVAVDNGDRAGHESFQAAQRHAYRGRVVAVVKWNGPGKIRVTASAPGLTPASLRIPE